MWKKKNSPNENVLYIFVTTIDFFFLFMNDLVGLRDFRSDSFFLVQSQIGNENMDIWREAQNSRNLCANCGFSIPIQVICYRSIS